MMEHVEHTEPTARHTSVVLELGGIQFATEKSVIEAVLRRVPGVHSVEANAVSQTAAVSYDPAQTSVSALQGVVQDCGYHCAGQSVPRHICDPTAEPDSSASAVATSVAVSAPEEPSPQDDHAADDESAVHSGHVGHIPPPKAAGVPEPIDHSQHGGNATASAADSGHQGALRSPEEVMGHGGHGGMSMESMVSDMRNRFLVAALLSVPIVLWSPLGRTVFGFRVPVPFGVREDIFQLLLSLPVIFYSARIFFEGAFRALRNRTLDMMVLVAVAVGAGWLYSVVVTLTGGGDVFYEAATVLAAFVLLGHWFEMRARGGASDAIRTLLNLAPQKAVVIRAGEPIEVATADVIVGDLVLVKPGAKIAMDGVVEEGEGEVDESMVTGESLPVSKRPGSEVTGATINKNGTLRVRATKVGADTALAQIVKLVQEAQNSKAPGQRLADRAAFWLVLVALTGGTGTLVVWLLAGRPLSVAILFAITVVVVTCPDALGLATPTAIMVGSGLGATRGILFKNATALETSARIQVVVMDKTGTLTKGEPEVTEIVTESLAEAELLGLTASLERESEHPLAEAIVSRADELGAPKLKVEQFENVPGHGALARVGGRSVAVGNQRLMAREKIPFGALEGRWTEMASEGRTVVGVAVEGRAAGLVAIADAARPTASQAVAALRERGVEVVMLTGDNEATARRIAAELGVTSVIADVLPGDKATKIAELQRSGRKVAMVGDGVNDAPALAQADLGIAIGAGTDVAIETADIVLMRSDPLDVATALGIGRGTVRKMHQNLAWAIGYNVIALPIAAGVFQPSLGLVLRPEIAAISMSGSSLLVAVNALMLKRLRLPRPGAPVATPQPDPGLAEIPLAA